MKLTHHEDRRIRSPRAARGGALVEFALVSFALYLVLAAIIGLMVGSVRVLWPWPNGVGVISEEEDEVVKGTDLGWADDVSSFLWPTVLAVVAFVIVLGISVYGERRAAGLTSSAATPLQLTCRPSTFSTPCTTT